MSVSAALSAALLCASANPGFGFDRVDLLSEDPGIWLHYDAPMARANSLGAGLRLVSQVKVAFQLPLEGLYAGASLQSQSLVYEHALLPSQGLFASVGLQTRLLLPRGALAGVAWRKGRLRLGASLSAFSEASWARPNWQRWTLLPTFGLGIAGGQSAARNRAQPDPGPSPEEDAPAP